jgi:hypothetical protein
MRLVLLSEGKTPPVDLGKADHFSGIDVFQDLEITAPDIFRSRA